MEIRIQGDGKDGCDRPSELVSEDTRKTRNHPNVCREAGRTHVVVRGTGEKGRGVV